MKYRIIFYFAAFLLAVPAVQAGPKIQLAENTYNFGKIIQHAVGNKRFWIKSVGDVPARIIEVKPDCGCTSLILEDSTIAPGDSAAIDVIFHSRAFMGLLSKRTTIRIADNAATTQIIFYAEVLTDPKKTAPLVFEPAKVDVSQFTQAPRRKATFGIQNTASTDFRVQVIDTSFKSFTVKGLPEVLKAGEKVDVQIIVNKDKVPIGFEESFTFAIMNETMSRYTVPIQRIFSTKPSDASLSDK